MRTLHRAGLLSASIACLLLASCETPKREAARAQNPMTPQSPAVGYLSARAPRSLSLVPPPPTSGSAAMAADEEVNRSALQIQGGARWKVAASDAVLTMPAVAQSFSCALDAPIGDAKTPRLIALLRRVLADAGAATNDAKDRYQRTRPFVVNGKPTCTPEAEARLRNNGSYPSGHAAIGFAFGLTLSEVAPDRGDALVARGRAFGQSRLACNVHWQSDVREGQLVAAAVVARLNANQAFLDDVAAARKEVEALRAQGAKSDRDCEAEMQALKEWN